MKKKYGKVAVIAIDIPWNNSECLGIFDSLEEANEAARKHIGGYSPCGEDTVFYPAEKVGEEGMGVTVDRDGEEQDDGYRYLMLACDGPCVYVAKEPYFGDVTYMGPYKDVDEANAKALRRLKTKFICVAGSFSYGYYPIDTGRTRYTLYDVYQD